MSENQKFRCPDKLCGWESTQRPTTWPCCPNCLVYEDRRKRLIEPDSYPCDHCDGSGRVAGDCKVGYQHEYNCDCPDELCQNCEGSGRIRRRPAETKPKPVKEKL